MSLKIRMSRAGAKKRPFYRIVVTDSRNARDGRFIERLGSYDPMLTKENEKRVVLNLERLKHWLSVGALPSDRVARFLGDAGLMAKPTYHEQPQQSQPKKKAQERLKAAAETAAKAEGAA
jgi:small subunit ribosomal protein S16